MARTRLVRTASGISSRTTASISNPSTMNVAGTASSGAAMATAMAMPSSVEPGSRRRDPVSRAEVAAVTDTAARRGATRSFPQLLPQRPTFWVAVAIVADSGGHGSVPADLEHQLDRLLE